MRTLPAYARSCRLTEGLELPELAWLPTAVGKTITFHSGADSHAIVYRDDESGQSR